MFETKNLNKYYNFLFFFAILGIVCGIVFVFISFGFLIKKKFSIFNKLVQLETITVFMYSFCLLFIF